MLGLGCTYFIWGTAKNPPGTRRESYCWRRQRAVPISLMVISIFPADEVHNFASPVIKSLANFAFHKCACLLLFHHCNLTNGGLLIKLPISHLGIYLAVSTRCLMGLALCQSAKKHLLKLSNNNNNNNNNGNYYLLNTCYVFKCFICSNSSSLSTASPHTAPCLLP